MAEKQAELLPKGSMTVVLDQQKIEELQKAAPRVLAQAEGFTIETTDDYVASAALLDSITKRQQTVIEFFDKPAKEANSLHKFITNLRGMLLSPYQQAELIIKNRRRDWRTEEDRKRLLQEEEERKRAKADADARALEEAKQMAEIGEHEAAETIIERAATAPAPPVFIPSTVPKQTGHTVRKVWKFRVKRPDQIKREFLVLDESKAQAIVSRLGRDAEAIIGGIEVFQDEIETSRRK